LSVFFGSAAVLKRYSPTFEAWVPAALALVLAWVAWTNLAAKISLRERWAEADESRQVEAKEAAARDSQLALAVGRTLIWPDNLEPTEPLGRVVHPSAGRGYRLVVLLNGFVCRLEQNAISGFLTRLQRITQAPEQKIAVVVESDDIRAATAFKAGRSIAGTVWLDSTGTFRLENRLPSGIVALIVDSEGTTVAAYSAEGTSWGSSAKAIVGLVAPGNAIE
jgi:hypothetical protein